MNIVNFKNTVVGNIYVTQGGLAEDGNGNIFPWGYERIRLLRKGRRKNQNFFIVETPWGTELELHEDYVLYNTTETVPRSEHKMIGMHQQPLQYIPFKTALTQGICKIGDDYPNMEIHDGSLEDIQEKFYRSIVNFCNKPVKLAEVAQHFAVEYQQMRYHIETIPKRDIGGHYYKLRRGRKNGQITIQFIKVI